MNKEEYFINSISIEKFNVYHLNVILNLKSQTLKYIQDNSFIYGSALFLYILFNIPANAIFIMMIIFSPMKLLTKCVLCIIVLLQLAVVFAIHLFIAFLSIKFHIQERQETFFRIKSCSEKTFLKTCCYVEESKTVEMS